ncbi:MAG: hypothetical protein PHV07_01870 [Oscillospiraceae bacterium]|nr:hypothetical protein [Oscillospiraceae bacterium]
MSQSNNLIPLSDISLEQAITDIIESLALEETALSEILNSESEIVLKTNKISNNIDDYIAVNESVNSIIKNVFRLQMMLQFELDNAEFILQKSREYYENDDLEE